MAQTRVRPNGIQGDLGGATGSGGDKVFYENDNIVTTTHVIQKNSQMVGPIYINTGATLSIETGKRLVIL